VRVAGQRRVEGKQLASRREQELCRLRAVGVIEGDLPAQVLGLGGSHRIERSGVHRAEKRQRLLE
jgi:hypothetical protein